MKYILLFSVLLLSAFFTSAQIVNIPDANFKTELLSNTPVIDTSGDGEIQVIEAEAYTGFIGVEFCNIYDLTGIEAFTNLNDLFCYGNHLTTIDLSANINLTSLDCEMNSLSMLDLSNNVNLTWLNCRENELTSLDIATNTALVELFCEKNEITSLDLSNNLALTYLRCQYNELSSLDLSNNTALRYLQCGFNNITTLDVSSNTALIELQCEFNNITILDVSSNMALTKLLCEENQLNSLNVKNGSNINISTYNFKATNNANLVCIQVDDHVWAEINWTYIDTEVAFSENCGVGIDEYSTDELEVYPNPFNDHIDLSFDKEAAYEINIFDMFGKKVLSTTFNGARESIPTSKLPNGAYIIKAKSKEGIVIKRIIKSTWQYKS